MIASIIFGNSYSHPKGWYLSCRFLCKLTLDIANHRVSEEDANKIIRSYLNF